MVSSQTCSNATWHCAAVSFQALQGDAKRQRVHQQVGGEAMATIWQFCSLLFVRVKSDNVDEQTSVSSVVCETTSTLRPVSLIHASRTSRSTARWPLRHAAVPDNYGQISRKTNHFRWWNVCGDMCRMDLRSFWSWFDVDRCTFDEDMSRKQKTSFTFSFSVTLIFDLQILNLFPHGYCCPTLCFH